MAGASRLEIDKQGNLLLHTQKGVLRQHRPIVYQEINGHQKAIAGSYVLLGQEVGFKVGAYDPSQRLVIDPVLSYSTYLGGSSGDLGRAIAVDLQGNVYVAGATGSSDPTKNALDSTLGGGDAFDAFVTKINPNASPTASLVYSTYLGGSSSDDGNGIALDLRGNAYVTGSSTLR